MRYLIFSDIHSNWEAFEVFLDCLRKEKPDKIIFLGDAVGYGADPEKVVNALLELKPFLCAGNHDWAVAGKLSLEYFNPFARDAIEWTRKNISPAAFEFLYSLPLKYEEESFICVHASIFEPYSFHYITNREEAAFNFQFLEKKLCFIGHTHQPEVYVQGENKIFFLKEEEIDIDLRYRYIINVGSIGQPRDRDPRICFCIYDEEKRKISYKRLGYNIIKAQNKILKNKLPPFLAYRLGMGI
ncbi:MAG: hypothetical protein B6D55_00765 [Candidatus Omnitrophica bacterium 4484_70.2]|nr:MAG: hypothetical protein B6D55_00765 [Candidatus Omnitrophica bacterium 4484_70.2]